MRLYDGPIRTCPRKARWALEEKGVTYERVPVDEKGDINRPESWFRAISPKGQLPVLEHGGRTLHESSVIAEYVNDAFDGPELLPGDAWARAQARLWMLRVTLDIHDPHQTSVNFATAFADVVRERGEGAAEQHCRGMPPPRRRAIWDVFVNGFESEYFRDGVLAYDRLFADMESRLGETEWLAGDRFSLAEIGTAPWVYRMLNEFGFGAGLLGEGRPRLRAWLDRVAARPAFRRAIFVQDAEPMIPRLAQAGRRALPVVDGILSQHRESQDAASAA